MTEQAAAATPLVSVVVTCYNYGRYLARCLRSLICQTLDPEKYEIIIVDDCSTDSTSEIAAAFLEFHGKNKPNITFISNQENLGVAGSANIGITNASGKYIVRVDADDYVNQSMLSVMALYLEQNDHLLCVSCDYIHVNEEEEKVKRFYAETDPISCGIMYHKAKLVELGMYNQDWRHREEEELRKRCGQHYKLDHLRMPFYRYRMHSSNKTKSLDEMSYFQCLLRNVDAIEE